MRIKRTPEQILECKQLDILNKELSAKKKDINTEIKRLETDPEYRKKAVGETLKKLGL